MPLQNKNFMDRRGECPVPGMTFVIKSVFRLLSDVKLSLTAFTRQMKKETKEDSFAII